MVLAPISNNNKQLNNAMFLGIDFGAKNAGTTAICHVYENKIETICTKKNQNADNFIQNIIDKLQPNQIFIDAPLSLPLAYYNKGNDFHFRECDRLLSAMSPMFLGGLTARAMNIKKSNPEVEFYETYPKMVSKTINIHQYYKTDIKKYLIELQINIEFDLPKKELNWHEIDSILAWIVGQKLNKKGIYNHIGNEEEGLIYY